MPAFLVGMAGPHLIIAGAIYLGAVVSATLTGYNSLTQAMPFAQLDKGFVSSCDQAVWHTAHTLRALHKCLDLLDAYYQNMQPETGDVPSDVSRPAPHFKEFQSERGRFTVNIPVTSARRPAFGAIGVPGGCGARIGTRIPDQVRGQARRGRSWRWRGWRQGYCIASGKKL